MVALKKIYTKQHDKISAHAHDLGGTLGMTAAGVAAGIAAGVAAASAPVVIPIGTAIGMAVVAGAAIGGAIGGYAAEELAREINPTEEEKYWEAHFHHRDYVAEGETFDSFRAAYRLGLDAYQQYPGQHFDALEPMLATRWSNDNHVDWNTARHAVRDAFLKVAQQSK